MLWQFFLAGFFAVIYAPYNTELEGYETPLQRFWYSCSNLMWGICLFWLIFACCRGYGGPINDLLSWSGWSPIAKVSFMTYLVHMDFNYWFFFSQDYPWDYNFLSNVSMFLGNLAVALSFGLLFCIGMELPLAKLQKIIIGAYVTRMTEGQKWTLPIFLTFIAVILFFAANALAVLWKKDLVGDLGLRVSEW
jgi:peptidoglycan/LPS O-acetylase OafA/YrhL